MKDKYRNIRQGQGEEFPSVGSMTFEKQVEIVESPYLDAKNRGAKILVGGIRKTDQEGLFHEPSFLIDVNHDMIIMQEETFGPEISVMPFSDGIQRSDLQMILPMDLTHPFGLVIRIRRSGGTRIREKFTTCFPEL